MTAATAWPVESPKIAAIYARISRDRDNDELGVARQREALREHIERHGWVLGGEYVDNDISASKGKHRPAYEALQRALRAGEADVLLCTEVSRLTRNLTELEGLVRVIEESHVQVVALRAGHIDLSTSGGRATAGMLGVMAKLESEQMSERIKSKMSQIAKAGGWRGGPRPFGYDLVNGRLVVNKREAALIGRWVADVLAGRTVSSIVTELNDKKVPTVRDGRWTGPTVNQILTSPRIIGMTSSGGEPVADAHWDAIVDRADWERLQGVLATRKRGPSPRVTLLAGLVWCSLCGSKMWGAARGPHLPRLYACQKVHGGCGRLTAVARAVDEYVVGLVLGAAGRTNLSAVRAERHVRDSERMVREVAEDEQMLSELAEDLGARRIGRAEWIAARGQIEPRLEENRAALRAVGAADQLPPGLATLDDETWDALPFDQRRAVIKLFIERIIVDPIGNKAGNVFRPERLRVSWRS